MEEAPQIARLQGQHHVAVFHHVNFPSRDVQRVRVREVEAPAAVCNRQGKQFRQLYERLHRLWQLSGVVGNHQGLLGVHQPAGQHADSLRVRA